MSEPKCQACGLNYCIHTLEQRVTNLESAGRALLELDKRYPKGAFYTYMDRTERYSELTALIERFRALLEPITSEDK
jgi:hypothetical protein